MKKIKGFIEDNALIFIYLIMVCAILALNMAIHGLVYHDPTCAFKTCVEVKELSNEK